MKLFQFKLGGARLVCMLHVEFLSPDRGLGYEAFWELCAK